MKTGKEKNMGKIQIGTEAVVLNKFGR